MNELYNVYFMADYVASLVQACMNYRAFTVVRKIGLRHQLRNHKRLLKLK